MRTPKRCLKYDPTHNFHYQIIIIIIIIIITIITIIIIIIIIIIKLSF